MKNKISKPNEFIIQNFRSWEQKNYIQLSDINFLFGGNSSGKSSIIAALSLLKQSYSQDHGNRIIERLKGNGEAINLGPIEHQVNFSAPDSSPEWRDQTLAFGARYRDENSITSILDTSDTYFDSSNHPKNQTKIDALEACSYFNPTTGVLQGVDLSLNLRPMLEIQREKRGDDNCFELRLNSNEKLLKSIAKKQKHEYDLEELIKKLPHSEDSNGLPPIIKRQLYDLRLDSLRIYARLQELEELEAERLSALREKETAKDFLEVKEAAGRDISKDSLRMEKLNTILVNHTEKSARLNYEIHSELRLPPPSGEPDLEYLNKKLSDFYKDGLQFPSSLLLRWENIETAISDLSKRPQAIISSGSKLYSKILNDSEPTFQNFLWGAERISHRPFDPELADDEDYETLIMWHIFSCFFTDFQNFISLMENTIYENSYILTNCEQIGPSRELPPRIGVIDPYLSANGVGRAAENLLNLLHTSEDDEIDQINEWMDRLELGYQIRTSFAQEFNVQRFSLVDASNREVAIHDVGYGVSQVLPIVMQLLLSRDKLITIEQPELHIHPKLQANLAELFTWSVENFDNWLIVETHSEHILLRLQRMQREKIQPGEKTPLIKRVNIFSDVNIHVIEKRGTPSRSICSTLKITSDGEFNGEWPGGFFEERYIEKGLI